MAVTARIALAALCMVGCHDDSCLRGSCKLPCEKLTFTCTGPSTLYIGRVGAAPAALRLLRGNGADSDIMISNGRVTAVISALDAPNDLAPTGGNLIDFGPAGGIDDITLNYQIAGILPADAFAYTSIDTHQNTDSVSITLRGTLDGRKDVPVVTHYELSSCDPGIRVHSELFNGSADKEAFFIADGMHWGKRRVAPFAPLRGQGYDQPALSLLDLSAQWSPLDFVGGATPDNDTPSYGALACNRDQLYGVNSLELSALGTPIEYVEPGDTVVLERMLVTGGTGNGAAPAIDQILLARAQLFGSTTQTVSGRIVAGGMPFGGDVRRASILIRVSDRPITSVIPAADGTFSASVPANEPLTVEVWSFGRKIAERNTAELGDIEVPEPAHVQLLIDRKVANRTEAAWAIAVFTPDDDATRADVTGTFHGKLDTCAPWLGPPNGPSPACNQVIVAPQGTEVEVPAGNYLVLGTAGPEHTLAAAHVQLQPGEIVPIALHVEKLDLIPAGWISADLHVHGRASFDSGFPDDDRVRTFVAAGVEVIAATDHDVIGDYTDTVAALGLDDRVVVMGGLETTQLIPHLSVPGESVPRVIGHFNFWPLVRVPSAPRAGAPWDELVEPGGLFDIMAPLVGDDGMMMLNHPWDEPLFGRDLGYLRAVKFDPRKPIDAGTNAVLLDKPAGQHRNVDWNIIEIINGPDMSELMKARTLWHSLLAQGFIAPGAGNSDSHGMTDGQLGWARNYVQVATQVIGFDPHAFNAALRDGRMIASDGVIVLVEVGPAGGARRGLGFSPYAPQPGDVLDITVKAAPWIPVDEVRIVTSRGTQVIATGLPKPDPFGNTGLIRYQGQIALSSILTADDFIIVEAGLAYPLAADLDNDGVVETTDNNLDGIVDDADVEKGEDTGPIQAPPDPLDPAHPRFLISRIAPHAWPEGFANPLFIDVDGNGWNAPGLP